MKKYFVLISYWHSLLSCWEGFSLKPMQNIRLKVMAFQCQIFRNGGYGNQISFDVTSVCGLPEGMASQTSSSWAKWKNRTPANRERKYRDGKELAAFTLNNYFFDFSYNLGNKKGDNPGEELHLLYE